MDNGRRLGWASGQNGQHVSQSGQVPRLWKMREMRIVVLFRLRGGEHSIELTPDGRLIVTWVSEEEKERLYSLLKTVLATEDGRPLEIRPLHTTMYRIPYPPPRGFTVPFCSDWIYYMGTSAREWWTAVPLAGLTPLIFLGIVVGCNEVTKPRAGA